MRGSAPHRHHGARRLYHSLQGGVLLRLHHLHRRSSSGRSWLSPSCAQGEGAQVGFFVPTVGAHGQPRIFLGMNFFLALLRDSAGCLWLAARPDLRLCPEPCRRRGLPQHLHAARDRLRHRVRDSPCDLLPLDPPSRTVHKPSASSGATSTWASWSSPPSSRPMPHRSRWF